MLPPTGQCRSVLGVQRVNFWHDEWRTAVTSASIASVFPPMFRQRAERGTHRHALATSGGRVYQ